VTALAVLVWFGFEAMSVLGSVLHEGYPFDAISTWAEHWSIEPKPFIWKATAEDILDKVQRGRATLHQIKSPADH
jgi:hypothetical protein